MKKMAWRTDWNCAKSMCLISANGISRQWMPPNAVIEWFFQVLPKISFHHCANFNQANKRPNFFNIFINSDMLILSFEIYKKKWLKDSQDFPLTVRKTWAFLPFNALFLGGTIRPQPTTSPFLKPASYKSQTKFIPTHSDERNSIK